MSSLAYTEDRFLTTDTNRHTPRTTNRCKEAIEITENEEVTNVSAANDKINFFRSMGLEFSKGTVLNANNNNDYDTIAAVKSSSASSFSAVRGISESFLDIPEQRYSWESRSKQKHRETSRFSDMPVSLNIVSHMRECSVMIIGDKCKVCGKTFKCIRDVQNHAKKKHRRKKPRKKLVLKIGNEVISRVPIRRKHLKWHRRTNHRTIVASEKSVSLCNQVLSDDRVSDGEIVPFVDLDGDTNDARSILTKKGTNDDLSNESKRKASDKGRECRANDDEEIQVLLRITRPRTSGPEMEINHETPNRTERELLISDAIREFMRMDNEPMKIIESEEHELVRDNDIAYDCCWLANGSLPNFHLDREERNCSFHIENDDDIEFSTEATNSSANGNNNNTYFNDGKSSPHSKEFRNGNGDVVPNFVDYAHSLDNATSHHRYNNNVCEVDSPFYNDVRINEWNNLTGVPKAMSCDSQCMNTGIDCSVLIKEEIMLEDLL